MNWISDLNTLDADLHFEVLQPIEHLREHIAFYWTLKCNTNAPFVEEYLAPDGFEEVIFSYGGTYRRRWSCENKGDEYPQGSYIVGAKNTGLRCLRTNTLNMIGVKLYPQSLYRLFELPLDQYFNKTLLLNDMGNASFLELEEKLYDAKGKTEVSHLLDSAFSNFFNTTKPQKNVDLRIKNAVKKITHQYGNISIDTLRCDLGCHYRTLEKGFRQQIGQSPKSFTRNIRFKHTLSSIIHSVNSSTPFFPSDFGYYDQSHFSKEFRFYTGMKPKQFFKESVELSTQVFDISCNTGN